MRPVVLRFRSAVVTCEATGGSPRPRHGTLCFDVEDGGTVVRDCTAAADLRGASGQDRLALEPPIGYAGPRLNAEGYALAGSVAFNGVLDRLASPGSPGLARPVHSDRDATTLAVDDLDFVAEVARAEPRRDTSDDGAGTPPVVVRGRIAQPIVALYRRWNEVAPRVRGRGVLLRIVSGLVKRGAARPIVTGEEGVRLEFGGDFVTVTVLMRGSFEPLVSERLRALVPRGGVCVDVGANVGYVTLLASRWVGPQGRVYAFEPARRTFERFRANLALNGATNVVPINLGCSSSVGVTELVIPGDDLGRSHIAQRDEMGERIEITTLDAYFADHLLERLDLLKIDVEGHDIEVLKGAIGTLRRFRPPVILEVGGVPGQSTEGSIRDVRRLMEPLRYRCELLSHESAYDVLCVPIGGPLGGADARRA